MKIHMLLGALAAAAAILSPASAEEAACPSPAPGCQVVTRKVLVTECVPQQYEATRTVYKVEVKEEKYTAYKCVVTPTEQTRKVTVLTRVPETHDVVVTRLECVPAQEEREITKLVPKTVEVTTNVTRCVDKGGHYECHEVPCGRCCGSCKVVSCYVPNLVTETVPVKCLKTVCEPVKEKVMVTVSKLVEKKETVKVTSYKCVPETREEKCVVNVTSQVPYEATRKVFVCVPVQEKVTLTRMVPVQVEKEITCVVPTCCESQGCGTRHCRGGLFHRCCD
jgi:hypothetical protein